MITIKTLRTGVYEGADILLEYLKGRISAQMSSIMIRTDTLRLAGGFPVSRPYSGDKATWLSLLLTGRAGFVNERCATHTWHGANETSRLAVDIRLKDDKKLVETIEDAVAYCIDDPKKRQEIRRHASRYGAREALWIIASYRRGGATLAEVLPIIWQWRRELGRIGIAGIFSLAKPLTILLLPRPITRWIGRLKRSCRRCSIRTGRCSATAMSMTSS